MCTTLGMGSSVHSSWHDGDGHGNGNGNGNGGYVKGGAMAEVETQIAVMELVQCAVEVLGWQVSGDLLTGPPYQHQLL